MVIPFSSSHVFVKYNLNVMLELNYNVFVCDLSLRVEIRDSKS